MVWIGLGSNLGDCARNLAQAVRLLHEAFPKGFIASAVYRSEPVELTAQPWFLNQVVAFAATPGLCPTTLLKQLQEFEGRLGRTPGPRYGPRLIDLDLLFFSDLVLECQQLTLPHPKLTERSFVLLPLIELQPQLLHPRLGLSIAQIWQQQEGRLAQCHKLIPDLSGGSDD